MPGLEGQNIGEFQILSKLGQGGMGTVYVARQSSLNRSVAIKVLPSHLAEDATFIQRFHREATVAASLSHPDIVQVLAAGEHEGTHYFAMEYVDGESLLMRLSREGRLDPAEALAITVRLVHALNYAWQKVRLIHRDIKPSNILISKEGQVKLADLGMAKCIGEETNHLTSSGMTLGTPHYTSPEQARSCADIDFRADIYSLGCTLYQMLTGQTPYKGSDSLAVMYQHVNEPPPDILKVMPDCPRVIVTLLNKMLAKDRNHRQQSYDELIEEMVAAHNQIPQQPVPAPKRQLHALTYAVATSIVVIMATGVFIWAPWTNRVEESVQKRRANHTVQRPQTAIPTSPLSGVATTDTSPPSTSTKPVGDAPTLPSTPAEASGKNNAPTTSPTAKVKPVALTPVTTQPMPPHVAASSNSSTATSSEQRRPADMVTTATSTPGGNTVTPTATEAGKNVPPTIPTPSPTNQPSVSDNKTAFLKSVVTLPPDKQITTVLATLKELNPNFDGKETHKTESGAVTELALSTVGVTDITPLKALKWLKKLSIAPPGINQRGALSDLSPLAGLPLTGLWCQGNAINDLSPLKDMPLTMLSCGGTQVKDLTPLAGMKLTVLSFNDTEVADLSSLEGMPLTVLWCNNTKVADLSLLKTMPLQELKCNFVAVRDTAILHDIKTLARINNIPVTTFWMRAGSVATTPPQTGVPQKFAASATPRGSQTKLITGTGMELVWIPPGEFLLGPVQQEQGRAATNRTPIDRGKHADDKSHKATIKQGFWISKTEVTVEQWKQFVTATSYMTDAEKAGKTVAPIGHGKQWGLVKGVNWKQPGFGYTLKDNHSVCCISWNDAVAFCDWLNRHEQQLGQMPQGFKFRLPTEAEWEYACRAGAQTTFWWGNSLELGMGRLNWYGPEDGFEFVSPVDHYGVRGRNRYGLSDMLGNVAEWCLDDFDQAQAHEECYKGNPGQRVMKGGSFRDDLSTISSAGRNGQWPSRSDADYGFRVTFGPAR